MISYYFSKALGLAGYAIRYRDDRGVWDHRYDRVDFASMRPVHADLSVAYPWAKTEIYKIGTHG